MKVKYMQTSTSKNVLEQGFTLIELLVVIGIIAVLAAIVLVAINPVERFKQARDAQRWNDTNAILNAVGQKLATDKGQFKDCLAGITTTVTNIGTGSGLVDLTCLVPNYMATLPFDPDGTAADTLYKISKDANSRVTVSGTAKATGADPITVTR
jgi:type IV pilus assembly protein PilA